MSRCLVLAILVLFLLSGCTRRFFRERADREVDGVLTEKELAGWQRFHDDVYPPTISRFADPTNPDRPPTPPDDPGADELSPHPQRYKQIVYLEGTGYLELMTAWDAENRVRLKLPAAEAAPLPSWLPADPGERRCLFQQRSSQPYILSLDQAAELGVINSREFQDRRESLYLAALPVTLERFAFLPQFHATSEIFREWAGKKSSVGKQNRWMANSEVGVSQAFTTGALLLFRVANRTVINLTGNQKHTLSQSTAILDVSQPLLRGGGQAVALEDLTQAERDLLYELRDFARFHREFYSNVATGRTASGGYLPALLRQAQIANEEKNVEELHRELRRFSAIASGPTGLSQLQVNQVEQDLRRAQSNVVIRKADFGQALDQLKLVLGVSTDLPLALDDTPLAPLRKQMQAIDRVIGGYTEQVNKFKDLEKDDDPSAKARGLIEEALLKSELVRGTKLSQSLSTEWAKWRDLNQSADQPVKLFAEVATRLLGGGPGVPILPPPPAILLRLEALRQERFRLEAESDQMELEGKPVPKKLADQLERVQLVYNLGTMELSLQVFEQKAWQQETKPDRRRQMRGDQFRPLFYRFALVLESARRERLGELEQSWPELPALRLNGIDLLQSDESGAQLVASSTALEQRLDLMNRRAEVVDAWRKLTVFANSLLGVVNLRYHMEVQTPDLKAQPLNFQGERSQHQLILNTELPLVRKLERNNYRASLISYQQSRRALMAAEDQILLQVRQELRDLRQLSEIYKLQQRALILAYLQVNQAREVLVADPDPGLQRDAATAAAALTQQLLNALRSVPQAENSLLSTWVSYQTSRIQLYRDLELLQVDGRGVWIDDLAADQQRVDSAASQPAADTQPRTEERPGKPG